MNIIKENNGSYSIKASADELCILNNSLNEICHGVTIDQFQTRLGYPRPAVEALLIEISKSLDES